MRTVQELCGVIQDEFNCDLPGAELGPEDNYFEHGGDSLSALRLVARLRATVAPDLQLIEVFRHPTAKALSTLISERSGVAGAAG